MIRAVFASERYITCWMHDLRRYPMKRTLYKIIFVLALVLALLVGIASMLPKFPGDSTTPSETDQGDTIPSATESTTSPTELPTEPPVVKESTATISATGDMLMHMPVIKSCKTDSGYDFSSIFRYFSDYVQSADLAVCNLETTLAGLGNGYSYSGYPSFNCPDEIVASLKNTGFDVILTANNHSYDTRSIGFNRTAQIIRDSALAVLGTKEHPDDPNFLVFNVNGIRLAMACYTYETDGKADQKALNTIPMSSADAKLINSFDYQHLDLFYSEISESMAQMDEQGVDAFLLFIHWGNEYQIQQNVTQRSIAQSLCDLGVDVIIGGHPHVVQPMELLTATDDENQKTICLYSMGNAVSNQRISQMNLKTGHTEDGLLFSVTFAKYSDGTVIPEKVAILPTWVNLHTTSGQREYNILPLDPNIEDWKTQFSLSDSTLKQALSSYDRTIAIIGSGLEQTNQYLAQHQAEIENTLGVVATNPEALCFRIYFLCLQAYSYALL